MITGEPSEAEVSLRGPWTITFTGRRFWLADPKPDDVCIEDIAHALSMICRFGGHTSHFYSIAQHCCVVALALGDQKLGPTIQLHGLLHDASEAYLGDVLSQLKPLMPDYRSLEAVMDSVMAEAFGLGLMPAEVLAIDKAVLRDEWESFMPGEVGYTIPEKGLGIDIHPWPTHHAEASFIRLYNAIQREIDLAVPI